MKNRHTWESATWSGEKGSDICAVLDSIEDRGHTIVAVCPLGGTDYLRVVSCRTPSPRLIAAEQMAGALEAILGYFDSGIFVRDTTRDYEDGWHLKMIPVVKSLGDAQAALAAYRAAKEGQ